MVSVRVTPGQLIDDLVITNIKIALHENIASSSEEAVKVARAKKAISELNKKRNVLIDEIDENFLVWMKGENLYPLFHSNKSYS